MEDFMWWDQLCAWVVVQCQNENELDQIQWKSLLSNIPEAARSQDVYTTFLHDWRKLIAEEECEDAFSLTFTQKMLSIIDSTLAHIAKG